MIEKYTDKLWKAIEKELLKVQDLETVVLKSHLLVETQINTALETLLNSSIDAVHLQFSQKLELLACIWPDLKKETIPGPRSPYENWKGLNRIRNKIAHQLSPENKRKMLVDWVTKVLGYKLKTINRTTVLRHNIIKAVVFEVAYISGRTKAFQVCSDNSVQRAAGKPRVN